MSSSALLKEFIDNEPPLQPPPTPTFSPSATVSVSTIKLNSPLEEQKPPIPTSPEFRAHSLDPVKFSQATLAPSSPPVLTTLPSHPAVSPLKKPRHDSVGRTSQSNPPRVVIPQNAAIIEWFKRELATARRNAHANDKHRASTLQKQIHILETQVPFPVTSSSQLTHLPFFAPGSRALKKIDELLSTGSIRKVVASAHCCNSYVRQVLTSESDPRTQAVGELNAVWGIGLATAELLFDQGYKSVADLRRAVASGRLTTLTAMQLTGLQYYEDMKERIPRAEVDEIRAILLSAAHAVYRSKDGVNLVAEICGSYRRGKASCGDIDLILCDSNRANAILPLAPLIDHLIDSGFIIAAPGYVRGQPLPRQSFERQRRAPPVSSPSDSGQNKIESTNYGSDEDEAVLKSAPAHEETFMGLCRLNRPNALARRLDIKSFPRENFAAAILYFTGSDWHNRSMRIWARKMRFDDDSSYSLSQRGLFRCWRNAKGEVTRLLPPMQCWTERDIYEALGLEYCEPHERDAPVKPKNASDEAHVAFPPDSP